MPAMTNRRRSQRPTLQPACSTSKLLVMAGLYARYMPAAGIGVVESWSQALLLLHAAMCVLSCPKKQTEHISLTFSADRYCVPLALGSRQRSSTTLCTIRSTRNGIACRLAWLALIPAMAGSLLMASATMPGLQIKTGVLTT